MSGVKSPSYLWLGFAPCSRSVDAMFWCPLATAPVSAVYPVGFLAIAFTSAPLLNRKSTASPFPMYAASCRAVNPSAEYSLTILGFSLMRTSTLEMCPMLAASKMSSPDFRLAISSAQFWPARIEGEEDSGRSGLVLRTDYCRLSIYHLLD